MLFTGRVLCRPYLLCSVHLDLDRVFFSLFFVLKLEELIGLPQALTELGMIDLPVVGIPSDHQTGGVGRTSCRTPGLLLFDGQMLLFLSLFSVDGGEEIKF